MPARIRTGDDNIITTMYGDDPYPLGEVESVLTWAANRGIGEVKLPAANFEGSEPITWSTKTPMTIRGATDIAFPAKNMAQTRFVITDPTQPAIVLDGVRGVSLRGLVVEGQNFGAADLPKLGTDPAIDLINFDFAQNGVTFGHTGLTVKGQSSGVVVHGCVFRSFYDPVLIGPEGGSNDAEGVMFHTYMQHGKRGVTFGHTQTKNWDFYACRIGGVERCIVGYELNQDTGADPRFFGGNLQACVQALDLRGQSTHFLMEGTFFESVISIGNVGQGGASAMKGATLSACTFNLKDSDAADMPYHLAAVANNVTIVGGSVDYGSVDQRMRVRSTSQAGVNFLGTKFNTERKSADADAPPVDKTNGVGAVRFTGVSYRDADSATGVTVDYNGTL
ncbi:MAG: hypothetical protein GVY18_13705 [Bacteroidetes bacterium]|jgi:hypothetical protein|nr:hypothetical protein [Bacteroidota bacterium]